MQTGRREGGRRTVPATRLPPPRSRRDAPRAREQPALSFRPLLSFHHPGLTWPPSPETGGSHELGLTRRRPEREPNPVGRKPERSAAPRPDARNAGSAMEETTGSRARLTPGPGRRGRPALKRATASAREPLTPKGKRKQTPSDSRGRLHLGGRRRRPEVRPRLRRPQPRPGQPPRRGGGGSRLMAKRPSDRRSPGRNPGPQGAFEVSMINVSCNSH